MDTLLVLALIATVFGIAVAVKFAFVVAIVALVFLVIIILYALFK